MLDTGRKSRYRALLKMSEVVVFDIVLEEKQRCAEH